MEKEKQKERNDSRTAFTLASPKRSHPKTSSSDKVDAQTQRSFLKRWLLLIFYSGIWQRVSLNRWSQRGCFPPLCGVEIELGITVWRHPHSFPTVSELQKGREKKKKRSSTAVTTRWCDLALIFRPRLETRLAFCPLWSVWSAQKDREMDEKGTICLRGNVFQVQADEAFAFPPPPPSPSWHCTASRTPEVKVGPTGPLSVALAQSPMGWGSVGCSGATRSLPHFWVPRSLGGRTKRLLPISSPRVAGYWFWDTPDALDSGGSPSLCLTTDTKQLIDHTQAVQPSYSWARLSRFVASLMTKSTCGHTNK